MRWSGVIRICRQFRTSFSGIVARLLSAYGRMHDGEPDAVVEFEAKRMRLNRGVRARRRVALTR